MAPSAFFRRLSSSFGDRRSAKNVFFDAHCRWVGEIPVNQGWVSNQFLVLLNRAFEADDDPRKPNLKTNS
jgi:hypothetical protein